MANPCGGLTLTPNIGYNKKYLEPGERIVLKPMYEEFTDGSIMQVGEREQIVKCKAKKCDCCGANGYKNIECEYCGQIVI